MSLKEKQQAERNMGKDRWKGTSLINNYGGNEPFAIYRLKKFKSKQIICKVI